jgi:hypothetical protein
MAGVMSSASSLSYNHKLTSVFEFQIAGPSSVSRFLAYLSGLQEFKEKLQVDRYYEEPINDRWKVKFQIDNVCRFLINF